MADERLGSLDSISKNIRNRIRTLFPIGGKGSPTGGKAFSADGTGTVFSGCRGVRSVRLRLATPEVNPRSQSATISHRAGSSSCERASRAFPECQPI